MRRGGEAGHVQPDLGQDGPGSGSADAGDLIQAVHHARERGGQLSDAVLKGGDVGAGFVDAGQHQPQQEGVVFGELPGKGLFQQRDLGSHPSAGQLREHRRATFPGQQRGKHLPPGNAEDVRDHRGQFDLGVFEELLHPVLLRGTHLDQAGPVASQVSQQPDRPGWHETGAQHLAFGDLG